MEELHRRSADAAGTAYGELTLSFIRANTSDDGNFAVERSEDGRVKLDLGHDGHWWLRLSNAGRPATPPVMKIFCRL